MYFVKEVLQQLPSTSGQKKLKAELLEGLRKYEDFFGCEEARSPQTTYKFDQTVFFRPRETCMRFLFGKTRKFQHFIRTSIEKFSAGIWKLNLSCPDESFRSFLSNKTMISSFILDSERKFLRISNKTSSAAF